MLTWQFRIKSPWPFRLAASTVAGCLLTVGTVQAGLFVGEFAPQNWVFTPGGPGTGGDYSYAVWTPTPPADPGSVSVYAAHLFQGSTELSLTLPMTSPGYVVNFRTSFFNPTGGNANQSLSMVAPGFPNVSLGDYPGPPSPIVNQFSVTLHPGETMSFLMFSDTLGLGDKKNIPYFTIDEWSVSPIPEASTWIAAFGLLLVGGIQFWLKQRGIRSAEPMAAA